ncbi:MAG: ABC transporter permease [Bacteroidales bacterium]|jgi:putative ABC transport system permease protein|nr:ABC transporter permease [Bacteroidales bacterium]
MIRFFRNFKKQRTVGLLNICSLSLGVMVAVIVGLWAINELSFDKFHKNGGRIYRTITNITFNGALNRLGSTYRPLGEQAKEELPVIEDMCRVVVQNRDVSIDDVLHLSARILVTDPNFFRFFTFPLKEGNMENILSGPDKVVISESAAAKYFPGQNPAGRSIRLQGRDFAVSGMMKDIPKNSSIQAELVFPFFDDRGNEWGKNDDHVTFFLLQEGVKPDALAEPLTQLVQREFAPFKNMGATTSLESINDMHFSSQTIFDRIIKGNKSLVMIFVLTAVVILVISCINFTNLFVATSFIRAKTIGIKKAIGSGKGLLIREFYRETACYVLVSIAVGLFLASLIMPVFNNFVQSNLTLDFTSPQIYIFLAGLFVLVVALAGSFPALYMTRFNVIETLSGKFKGKKVSFFQKSLVITQFAASITLLIVVGFMQKQVDYIISYDLGFNKEHVVYVQGRDRFERNYKALEGEFLQEPAIKGMARKNSLPTDWQQGWGVRSIPSNGALPVVMEICRISPDYFDFFDMEMIDGENPFFPESSSETHVVINERAALLLGLEQPVGQMIALDGEDENYTVKGVVRNAYTKSLHQDVDPQLYIKLNDEAWNTVFFKIEGDPQRAIGFIEQKWKEREAGHPFACHFLDDAYKQLYTSEMNAGRVLSFAMLVTFMITVAGLFAMAYYATQRRVREIALRKVHGATVRDIFVLLNKDFLLWIVIAFAIACPVAYYGLHEWLNGFVIRTPLSAWVFLLVGFVALAVTLLTTGYQTWKVATANPVKSLKTE